MIRVPTLGADASDGSAAGPCRRCKLHVLLWSVLPQSQALAAYECEQETSNSVQH